MNTPIDLLQIKIEEAKRKLPDSTRRAIDNVNWRAGILALRAKKGYTFEQLESLEIETELVLCGLLLPEDYLKELKQRMKISDEEANELVNEMNSSVFGRIREELIKDSERNKTVVVKITGDNPNSTSINSEIKKDETKILNKAGIEVVATRPSVVGSGITAEKPITPAVEPRPVQEVHPLLIQKLAGSFQIPATKTEHSLSNISKVINEGSTGMKNEMPKVDPYREIPQ